MRVAWGYYQYFCYFCLKYWNKEAFASFPDYESGKFCNNGNDQATLTLILWMCRSMCVGLLLILLLGLARACSLKWANSSTLELRIIIYQSDNQFIYQILSFIWYRKVPVFYRFPKVITNYRNLRLSLFFHTDQYETSYFEILAWYHMITMSTVAPHNGLSELYLNRIQISTRKVFNVRFSLRISDILLLHQE